MKHIPSFHQFINESSDQLDSLVNSIISSKEFTPEQGYTRGDIQYYKSDLKYQLNKIGINDKIAINKLVQHPNFDDLDDRYKDIIYKKAGMGKKSSNAAFIKLFAGAMQKFPKLDRITYGNETDKESVVYGMSNLRDSMDEGSYPDSYNFLDYSDVKALQAIIKYGSEIQKTLAPDEIQFLQKICKPKYETAFKRYLSDEAIANMIKWRWAHDYPENKYSDESQFVKGINLIKDMPELFKFMKNEILTKQIYSKDWESLNVKLKMTDSKHSAVVSSSFSTTYYYDIEVEFMGKKFTAKNIALSSSYYSGGWN